MTNPFDKIATQICIQMHALAETFSKLAEIQAEAVEREPEAAPAKDGEVRWEDSGKEYDCISRLVRVGEGNILRHHAAWPIAPADRARIRMALDGTMDAMVDWMTRETKRFRSTWDEDVLRGAQILAIYDAAMKGDTNA